MASRDYFPVFEGIGDSDRFLALPDDTCRMFWTLLGTKCDSWGRATADPDELERRVWPRHRKGAAETARCLKALADVGLVSIYRFRGRGYVQFGGWEQYAGIIGHAERRGLSRFPDPRGFVAHAKWREKHGRSSPWVGADSSGSAHDPIQNRPGPNPDAASPQSGLSPDSVRSGQSGDGGDGGDGRRDSKSPPTTDAQLPAAGARPRPAGAGRAPDAPQAEQQQPASCPHCHGQVVQQVQAHPAPTYGCSKHPTQATAGVLAAVCLEKPRPKCRTFLGPREPFGPRACALCTAAAVARGVGAA